LKLKRKKHPHLSRGRRFGKVNGVTIVLKIFFIISQWR